MTKPKELSLCVADVGDLDPWQVYACASSECGLGERRFVRAENIFRLPVQGSGRVTEKQI
jgi:hypothetical protein